MPAEQHHALLTFQEQLDEVRDERRLADARDLTHLPVEFTSGMPTLLRRGALLKQQPGHLDGVAF
ncbi:Uncharacterised protein [Mycobacteroides abscessus subsp. massiliense]|uniref:Uncharacterized protein n=1 Tax=Mycobacteroides abscessus subsp. massiliense TaxID=1962118 RepID=A0A1T8VHF7_9MYCO|nr:Uncharacterised protein [Mycobacteroides abscessus subsp. massiliense]